MEVSLQFIVLVPVVVGLVKAVRMAGVRSKWLPLVSIAMGIATVYVLGGFNLDIIQGIIVGLTASGLWSGTKSTFGK